ncbi:DUF1002 domain-containing protein [Levilactobacillus suantsaii]|uniref:DUF1002 domain-containing protein n=1 Tax=Levilactobacillus suantsaii TaxID=2292255 RepID=A0A4Q0VLF6_9LACO|nr:DUF1002 domain-containing protein [Levilactobacillus suantsaii]QMU07450.1 DUF1002 domain-containing protein [Levilactobacillus suantsaii]RXI79252.1 DUF1002 domain-containing protein [Levilactobacillus suantsaii]
MKLKRILVGLAVVSATLAAGSLSLTSHADTTGTTTSSSVESDQSSTSSDSGSTVQTKALSKAYAVYGAGLASEDKDKVSSALGVKSNYTSLTATGSDYAKYLNSAGTTDASMISSVALAPADPGSGVKVNIVKYDGQNNITQVKSQQYAMVATMAGVKDVIITVTADKSVSGESALTGVYKALAADGLTLNSANTQAANSVLDATQPAINSNSDNKKYPGKLMAAVGSVSSDLAQQRQKGDKLATKADIEAMLKKALSKQGVSSQTTQTQINNISVALSKVQKAPVSTSKSYVTNVKTVANNLANSIGDKMASVKDFANSADAKKAENFLVRIWHQVVSFFQGLFS